MNAYVSVFFSFFFSWSKTLDCCYNLTGCVQCVFLLACLYAYGIEREEGMSLKSNYELLLVVIIHKGKLVARGFLWEEERHSAQKVI